MDYFEIEKMIAHMRIADVKPRGVRRLDFDGFEWISSPSFSLIEILKEKSHLYVITVLTPNSIDLYIGDLIEKRHSFPLIEF